MDCVNSYSMVSTRSHSRLSGSSLVTEQEGDVDAGEVNSDDVIKTTRGRRRAKAQTPNLDSIAEAPFPAATNEERRNTRSSKKQRDDDASIIDKLADQIFAALDQTFGNKDDEGSDSDLDATDHAPSLVKNLTWRPSLSLPKRSKNSSLAAANSSRTAISKTTAALDELASEKKGNTSKLLHVPPPDQRVRDRAARKHAPDTAGKDWFDLPATEITDEIKTDLRVLRLRSALDPKTFYKKFDETKFPKHFQMGTVIEGPTEYYSSRLTNKQRKRTMAEEIMADDHLTQVRKKRYTKMQEEKAQWSSKKGRKTDNPRLKKKPRRPKH